MSIESFIKGNGNTAIGTQALLRNIGNNNTAIGNKSLSNAKYNNCTGIGHGTKISGDNQVQLGNSATTTYCYGSVQNRSDRRDKADIRDTELGLDFVLGLKPVDFRWDYREDYIEEIVKEDGSIEIIEYSKDGSKKRERFHQGFIAQDIKELMDRLGVDFGGYQNSKVNGGDDILSLGYTGFIAPIVKAIHEQQQIITELKNKIKMLEDK